MSLLSILWRWGAPAPPPVVPAVRAETPSVIVEVAFTTSPSGDPLPDPAWVDVTAYLRSWGLRRGRQRQLDRTEAGTAYIVLDNRDRRFDPTWELGPYYGYVKPLRRVRIRAVIPDDEIPFSVRSSYVGGSDLVRAGDISVPLFAGYVANWRQDWPGKGFDATATATCVDAFGPMSMTPVGWVTHFGYLGQPFMYRAMESPDTRIAHILTGLVDVWDDGSVYYEHGREVRWPSYRLDHGWATLAAYSNFDGTDGNTSDPVLGVLQEVATSDGGNLYVGRDGAIVYRDGQTREPPPGYNWETPSVPDGHVFGHGGHPIADIVWDSGEDNIYNEVTVTNGAGSYTAGGTGYDQTSKLDYFVRRLSLSTIIYASLEWAQYLADLYWQWYKDPHPAIVELAHSPDDWRLVLERDLWDKVRVRVQLPNGSVMEQDSLIEGITIDSPNRFDWRVSWRTSVA